MLRTLDHATARTAVHLATVARFRGGPAAARRRGPGARSVAPPPPGRSRRESRRCLAAAEAPAPDRRAFLRGVLLATRSLSFSPSGPHVEFVLRERRRSRCRSARRSRVERPRALRSVRRGRHIVYLKGHEEIAALLRLVGANRGVLELETHRVGRDVRSRLNRLLNAEEANLGRTVRAAGRQLAAIARLDAEGRLLAPRRRTSRGSRDATPHAGCRPGYPCGGARRQPIGRQPSAPAARGARHRRGHLMRTPRDRRQLEDEPGLP